MRNQKANRKANAKAVLAVVVGLFILSKVQVHASVAGASCSASVLALIVGAVGLLVLASIAGMILIVTREFRCGIYRPRHAS